MGFFISRYWNKEEPGPKADEWWPTDYTPALTVEDWLELLTDKDVFNESSLVNHETNEGLWWKGYLHSACCEIWRNQELFIIVDLLHWQDVLFKKLDVQ